jgi:hypothetical protein
VANLVEDWESLERYAGQLPGFYQLLDNDGRIEIRVWIDKFGFKTELADANDPKLMQIIYSVIKSLGFSVFSHSLSQQTRKLLVNLTLSTRSLQILNTPSAP